MVCLGFIHNRFHSISQTHRFNGQISSTLFWLPGKVSYLSSCCSTKVSVTKFGNSNSVRKNSSKRASAALSFTNTISKQKHASFSHSVCLSVNKPMVVSVGSLSLFTNYLRKIHAVMGDVVGREQTPGEQ